MIFYLMTIPQNRAEVCLPYRDSASSFMQHQMEQQAQMWND
jgi:hypothetical protein